MRFPLLLSLLAAALLLAPACGGGEGDRSAGIIHRLLLAAGVDQAGALESFVGRLPDGLPVKPPQYPGADLIVSSRQPAPVGGTDAGLEGGAGAPRPLLYLIVLDTGDERAKVYAFYAEALDKDPWQIESAFSTEQLDTFEFTNVEDADIAGAVSISSGGEDARTSILISLQDAGAVQAGPPDGATPGEEPFELGESLPLPKGFPPDVPAYEGATITGSAFFREPGSESFLLIFLTPDSQGQVIEFYREEFQGRGWTVEEGAAVGLEDRIDFQDARQDIQGDVVADRSARARRFTEVRIEVRVNPARQPASDGATPEPTEAPPGETSSPR
ncbi:MAG: hypothetical protein A2148_03250 [Chloroflexi bacterium RBG_16_68_14]|nr:MAG: hypothetical protein A2148_03250 [Chloroflexi bacterium RBG_16_68_14]